MRLSAEGLLTCGRFNPSPQQYYCHQSSLARTKKYLFRTGWKSPISAAQSELKVAKIYARDQLQLIAGANQNFLTVLMTGEC
jgi:hypothetical protein